MPLSDTELIAHVNSLLTQAEEDSTSQTNDRDRALEYYNGEMDDTPSDEGRSSVVSKDLRANVRKIMPSIMRTLFGGRRYVEYKSTGPGNTDQSAQASDYVNNVVMPNCNGEDALYDAVFDAALLRTGILTWEAIEEDTVEVQEYTGYNIAELQ